MTKKFTKVKDAIQDIWNHTEEIKLAKQLVKQFEDKDQFFEERRKFLAKETATQAVDLILSELKSRVKFYKRVKKEIELL